MKKTISTIIMIALVCALVFTFVACENKEETITIKSFEIEDYELIEGAKFDKENIKIVCHKSDDTTVEVKNNLVFDKTSLEGKIDSEEILSDDSAGEYTIPVYHLDIHIGDLKLIVKVKK